MYHNFIIIHSYRKWTRCYIRFSTQWSREKVACKRKPSLDWGDYLSFNIKRWKDCSCRIQHWYDRILGLEKVQKIDYKYVNTSSWGFGNMPMERLWWYIKRLEREYIHVQSYKWVYVEKDNIKANIQLRGRWGIHNRTMVGEPPKATHHWQEPPSCLRQ